MESVIIGMRGSNIGIFNDDILSNFWDVGPID